MTAWVMGQIIKYEPLTEGATVAFPQTGPYLVSARGPAQVRRQHLRPHHHPRRRRPGVDFPLEAAWLKRGSPELGVPMLKVAFPLALTDTTARYEVPMGNATRPTDPP